MKKPYTSFVLTSLLFSCSAVLFAQNTWNGGALDGIDDAADWQTGLPTSSGNVGIINSDAFWSDVPTTNSTFTLSNYYLDIQSGTLSNDGGENVYDFNGGEITVSGGSIDSFDRISLSGGADMTLSSGSINTNTEDLFVGSANATYLQSGGTLTTFGVTVNNATASFTVNGGTVNSSGALFMGGSGGGFKGFANFNGGDSNFGGDLDLDDGATLTFGGSTAGTVDFGGYNDRDADAQQFNWLTGSLMAWTITGADSTFYEALWTAGDLTVDNGQTGTFASNFNVSGATLTLIPEPSSLALLAFAGLAALFLRRRQ